MAGAVKIVDSVVGIAGTTFKTPTAPEVAHTRTVFLLDVLTITGTWDVTVRRGYVNNSIDLAKLTGIASTGVKIIPIVIAYDDPNYGFPEPNEIEYTLSSGPGSLTADLVANYGD